MISSDADFVDSAKNNDDDGEEKGEGGGGGDDEGDPEGDEGEGEQRGGEVDLGSGSSIPFATHGIEKQHGQQPDLHYRIHHYYQSHIIAVGLNPSFSSSSTPPAKLSPGHIL